MKTNKDRALIYLNDLTDSGHITIDELPLIKEAVELASKPDWYYPNEEEIPLYNTCFVNENGVPCIIHDINNIQYLCLTDNTVHNIENLKAWTYLPRFEEND